MNMEAKLVFSQNRKDHQDLETARSSRRNLSMTMTLNSCIIKKIFGRLDDATESNIDGDHAVDSRSNDFSTSAKQISLLDNIVQNHKLKSQLAEISFKHKQELSSKLKNIKSYLQDL